jgi:hypothetical protein
MPAYSNSISFAPSVVTSRFAMMSHMSHALYRLNPTGDTMVLNGCISQESKTGFSCAQTGLFQVTKQAPNEA